MKILCSLWFLWALPAAAGEVIQVAWPTQMASPPATVSGQAARLMPAFRVALQNLPEGMVVSLALSQPAILGLSDDEARTLGPLVAERYKAMAADVVYRAAPSALRYCFSLVKTDQGVASVHVPDGYGSQTPVIVFLHGYGGSFLWYQHYLAQHFPKHLIICPAYGITPSAVPSDYVSECLAAVEKRLGHFEGKPWLLGLSAGGFGACRVFTDLPGRFAGLICIAAYPLSRQDGTANTHFIAGADEVFVKSGQFQRLVGGAKSHLIPGAGHFFLLTHENESVAKLREWLSPDAR